MQLRCNGKILTYDVVGNGADTIIFIHALGATREMWRFQIPAFSSDYTVVTYDAAGHDPTSLSEHASLAEYAADLLALTDIVNANRPHIVGLSLGGMIAQEYGARYPQHVKSLVLACTTSFYPPDRREQFMQRASLVEREGMEALVQPTLERWFTHAFIETHSEPLDWVRTMLASADPNAYAQAARVVGAVDTTASLAHITVPVLVLSGEDDGSMPPDSAPTLLSHIHDSRQAVIADASHLANVEQPSAFNKIVMDFVREAEVAVPGDARVYGLGQPKPA